MTVYAIYHPNGEIHQANKVYESAEGLKKYEQLLRNEGYTFSKMESPTLFSPDQTFVNTNKRYHRIQKRPVMPIVVDKTTIKCDGKDQAIFRNIRPNASLTVRGAGEIILDLPMIDAKEFAVLIPVPMTYTVEFSLWPFQRHTTIIRGIKP